ncbi:MAG: Type 1 glutamine amidotransferase-like domain-containing protein [Candidatus Hodarchaeales archaeon]|jgi:peptidase E
MLMIVVLFGGEDVKKRNCEHIQRKYTKKGSKVLIIPWTTYNKENKYRKLMRDYYTDLGASVEFLERADNEKIVEKKIKLADIIYLPGGDIKVFLESLRKKSFLIDLLLNFNGILIGNSAGAYALSKFFVSFHEKPFTLGEGLGITDLSVVVHYEESMEERVRDLEKRKRVKVVRIRESSAIEVRT